MYVYIHILRCVYSDEQTELYEGPYVRLVSCSSSQVYFDIASFEKMGDLARSLPPPPIGFTASPFLSHCWSSSSPVILRPEIIVIFEALRLASLSRVSCGLPRCGDLKVSPGILQPSAEQKFTEALSVDCSSCTKAITTGLGTVTLGEGLGFSGRVRRG